MSCKISNLSKYVKRKSPSIPANDCELGRIEMGKKIQDKKKSYRKNFFK